MVTRKDIEKAYELLAGKVKRTPVLTSRLLNSYTDCNLSLKCENAQTTGAFKARGALYSVMTLPEGTETVVTHSSGNHGAALAWAAQQAGLRCYVVCPETASSAKVDNILSYDGEVIRCGPELADRETVLQEFLEQHDAEIVHPYDADATITGQGTVALEFLEQVPHLDEVWVPIGGGGLASGCVIASDSAFKVVGVEPELAGETAASLKVNARLEPFPPKSMADGLLAGIGERNFEILRSHDISVHLVTEHAIETAVRTIRDALNVSVEPSAAVPLAGVAKFRELVQGKSIGVVLTGGNVSYE